jgi:hypothetical protein
MGFAPRELPFAILYTYPQLLFQNSATVLLTSP